MKNVGKVFEEIIKRDMPDYIKVTRIPDPPQSFVKSKDTKYSNKNPYDFECFDSNHRILYCLELKSTLQKYMGFQTSEDDKRETIIKWHQIEGLTKASRYKNVIAGFFCNFRLDNGEQLLYFFDINNFNRMRLNINKKSFNIIDAISYGAIKINGIKKRVHYKWDLDSFFLNMDSHLTVKGV